MDIKYSNYTVANVSDKPLNIKKEVIEQAIRLMQEKIENDFLYGFNRGSVVLDTKFGIKVTKPIGVINWGVTT